MLNLKWLSVIKIKETKKKKNPPPKPIEKINETKSFFFFLNEDKQNW